MKQTTKEMGTKPKGVPLHETCKEIVQKPTLMLKRGEHPEVWLQWFGESDRFDVSDYQFLFPVNTSYEGFFYQPENFEIIMIGPVKNWPYDTSLGDLVKQYGGENEIIIYCISSKFGVDDGKGQTIPAGGVLPLNIKLFDENCGIINPQEFFDDSVRLKVVAKFLSPD